MISAPILGKVEVFSRQAFFSSISAHKKRFEHFSHEKCYHNLLTTLDREKANLTFIFDSAAGSLNEHFLKKEIEHPIIAFKGGSEAKAFSYLLEYVVSLNLPKETLLYFLEDDYLHRMGWVDVLLEAFQIPDVDYATLYDHRDKYFSYPKDRSRIFATPSCHWRSTPSTTNTFAVRMGTLLEDLAIHQKFSQNRDITADHEKFLFLQKKGRLLISCLPGWSTHAEPDFASPCIAWEKFLTSRSSYVS